MKESEELTSIILTDEMTRYRTFNFSSEHQIKRCPFCESETRNNLIFHACGTELNDSDREDWIDCQNCKCLKIFVGLKRVDPYFAGYLARRQPCVCPIPITEWNGMMGAQEFNDIRIRRQINIQNN